MEALYPYALIVHLFCAIIFLGFIFTDVVLFSAVRKKLGDEVANKMFRIITQRGEKIMPLCLILLVITGGMMLSSYINSDVGYFTSNLQKILWLKVLLAGIVLLMVIISLSCKFLKIHNPLANIIHPAALFLGFGIVLCAKLAFYL